MVLTSNLCTVIVFVVIKGVRAMFLEGAGPSFPEKIFRQRPKNCYANLQNRAYAL